MLERPTVKASSGTGDATRGPGREAGAYGIAADQLIAIIERVERLHEERKAILSDIGDIYKEAKSNGFNCPAIQHLVKLRAMDPSKRAEQRELIELYAAAIGELV